MALRDRLRHAAERARDIASNIRKTVTGFNRKEPPRDIQREVSQTVADWVAPQPVETPITSAAPTDVPNDISELGSWESGLFGDYIPESQWDNEQLLAAFDTGFGAGMEDASRDQIEAARDAFRDWVESLDIDFDWAEFWDDWRDAYSEV